MSDHAAPKAPTLSKVKAGGPVAGLITLIVAGLGEYVLPDLGNDAGKALVTLVSALVVWAVTQGVMWTLKELHAGEYADAVYGALGLEYGGDDDLTDDDLADDDLDDEEDYDDDGDGDDDFAEPLDEPADDGDLDDAK